ncbi:MAG: hypothetical protein ACK5JT_04825 [Hyphomicrobiaceae bacterium]
MNKEHKGNILCRQDLTLNDAGRTPCATARNKGLCQNRLTISRERLEATVLSGLKHHLMAPDLFKEFCDAFIAELNQARSADNASRATAEAELVKVRRRLRQIVDAIAEGIPARTLKDELLALEAREDALKAKIEATPEHKVVVSPAMAEIYRARVAKLHEALDGSDAGREAMEAIRLLLDRVVLVPVEGKLAIDLYGEIGPILQLAAARGGKDVLGPVSGLDTSSDGCGGWLHLLASKGRVALPLRPLRSRECPSTRRVGRRGPRPAFRRG